MGSSVSTPPISKATKDLIDPLQMTGKHVKRLYQVFRNADNDRTGSIDYNEFYELVGERQSIFADEIFRITDLDNSNSLDFNEFIHDKNGYIENEELLDLVSVLHGTMGQNPSANIERALKDFEVRCGNMMGRKKQSIQRACLGTNFWDSRKRLRKEDRDKQKKEREWLSKAADRKQTKKQHLELKKRFGVIRYHLMPWKYDRWIQILNEEAVSEAMGKAARDRFTKNRKDKEKNYHKAALNAEGRIKMEKEERKKRREKDREREMKYKKRKEQKGIIKNQKIKSKKKKKKKRGQWD